MCLILFAYKVHPSYPLILAANRDEFFDRPSVPADFWKAKPQVLAGRDLQGKGTWMGMTKEGRYAAITNYRDPGSWRNDTLSRGKIVSAYLTGKMSPEPYLKKIMPQAQNYNGFNLLLGDVSDLFVYSSRGEKQKLTSGIYGLSNHLLNTPWPKVSRGKRLLKSALDKKGDELEKSLFDLLADRHVPPDSKLPQTGLTLEWERILSSLFIQSPGYGTRSSTVLLIGKNRRIKFVEKVFDGQPQAWVESRFSFLLEK